MDNGIITVAFGEDYDSMAAHTMWHSRQFTDLPIHVLTNIPEADRCDLWSEVPDITFTVFDMKQEENRFVKTQMLFHTPFARTIYIDCDSLIQNPGIGRVFDRLEDHDMVLFRYYDWKPGDKVVAIAKRVMSTAQETLPLEIYCGGFIGFTKSDKCRKCFDIWHSLWKATGGGREMIPLSCAVKKSQVNVSKTLSEHKIFEPESARLDVLIQHCYMNYRGKNWFKDFSIPEITQCKPFDATANTDWTWVDM